jgi:hypothetical protein
MKSYNTFVVGMMDTRGAGQYKKQLKAITKLDQLIDFSTLDNHRWNLEH